MMSRARLASYWRVAVQDYETLDFVLLSTVQCSPGATISFSSSLRRFPLASPQPDHDPTLGCRRWMPEPQG